MQFMGIGRIFFKGVNSIFFFQGNQKVFLGVAKSCEISF